VAELYGRCSARGLLDVAPQKVAAVPIQTREPEIFLSYASEDRQLAVSVRDQLAEKGFSVWFDIGIARAWFALSRQTYQQLLTREPNSRIAIVRLVLATANQALVSEQLGDDRHLGDDWRHGGDWADEDDIVPLLKDRVKYSRRLFQTDRSNPYFAALLSTGLMIEASQIAGLTGEGDKEVITPLKPICRGAFRLAQEALEITQCNLREDLFSTYERICSKLGYHEELARVNELERTAKSRASRPEPLQLSAPIRATISTTSFDPSLPEPNCCGKIGLFQSAEDH
jgi:hypothetical protein